MDVIFFLYLALQVDLQPGNISESAFKPTVWSLVVQPVDGATTDGSKDTLQCKTCYQQVSFIFLIMLFHLGLIVSLQLKGEYKQFKTLCTLLGFGWGGRGPNGHCPNGSMGPICEGTITHTAAVVSHDTLITFADQLHPSSKYCHELHHNTWTVSNPHELHHTHAHMQCSHDVSAHTYTQTLSTSNPISLCTINFLMYLVFPQPHNCHSSIFPHVYCYSLTPTCASLLCNLPSCHHPHIFNIGWYCCALCLI